MENKPTLTQGNYQSLLKRVWIAVVSVLLVVAAAGGYVVWRNTAPVNRAGSTPRNEAIEQRWGIRVTQIGVTADGGLLDFRYLVLDADKALSMFDDEKTQPQLITESNGAVITAKVQMVHKHDLRLGETYFVLFYNPQGLVKPGTDLGVKIGELQLDHIIAK